MSRSGALAAIGSLAVALAASHPPATAQVYPPGTLVETHLAATFTSLTGTEPTVDSATFQVNPGEQCCLFSSFDPPTGSILLGYEFEACDMSASGSVNVSLLRCPTPGESCVFFANASTGVAESPGCVVISGPVAEATDNVANKYVMQISDTDDSADTVAVAVRLYWQRELPPAPQVPTFADVPADHPFYRHIEGLWGAGATSGCATSPLQFCPNSPITRGEMAVFLSRLLGLYWPLPRTPAPPP